MSSGAPRAADLLRCALPACGWGCWSLFLRPSGLAPTETTLVVFAVMGGSLLPLLRRDPVRPAWGGGSLPLLAAMTLLDLLNVATFFGAMHVSSIGIAVLTHYLAPVLVALIGPVFGEERIPRATLWAVIATLGLALVLEPWAEPGAGVVLGALLGTASAVGYAGNVLVLRRLAPRIGPVRAIGFHGLLAALLLLPFADWSAVFGAEPLRLAWLLAGAVLLAGFGSVVFTRGLTAVGATRATMLAYLEPLVAVVVGSLVWGETHSPLALLGGALILIAGLSASTSRRRS